VVTEHERERGEIFVWRKKRSERVRSRKTKRREKERKSNESKYNVKGYLIVSTLYPRLE